LKKGLYVFKLNKGEPLYVMEETMKAALGMIAALGLTMAVGAAKADPWVDYTPTKGVWVKTWVHVEPSKIDDYLVALKKTWVPGEEMAKSKGLIDDYIVQVAVNDATAGPNVMLGEHYVSFAMMDPNKERDLAMEAEFEKMMPKQAAATEQENRAKYRTMVSEDMWTGIDFGK